MNLKSPAIKVAIFLLVASLLAGCNVFSRATPQALPTLALDSGAAPSSGASTTSSQVDFTGVRASGVVAPAQQAQLAFTLAGKLEAVNVTVGDHVEAGQAIAQLEGQESMQATISAAQFELTQAQLALDGLNKDLDVRQAEALKAIADYQDAVRDAERVILNMNTSAPQVDLDAAYANMILAKSRLERARDDYEPYEKKDEDNPVRAGLLSKLAAAQKAYDATVRTYNNLGGTANPIDLQQAQANLEVAQAQLAKAQRDHEILKVGPDPDQVRLAEARLANAETQLTSAQAALDHLTLSAPFAGTISSVNLHAGEWVLPGQTVVVLADLDHMRIETTDLSERDIPGIKTGQTVTAFVKALNLDVSGVIVQIAPLADTLGGDVVFKTTIELDAPPAELRAGMSVEVQFEPES